MSAAPRAAVALGLVLATGAPGAGPAPASKDPQTPSTAAAAAPAVADPAALMALWPGVYDTNEQLVFTSEQGFTLSPEGSQLRLHQLYAHLALPWLGRNVLYFEESLHDDPGDLKRQLLMVVEPGAATSDGKPAPLRVRQLRFAEPGRWQHLHVRPGALARLKRSDLIELPGCDLLFVREGPNFHGSMHGSACRDDSPGAERYLDQQVLVGEQLYWYRTRWLRVADDELDREIAGYPWFEPFEARLFTCRIAWSRSGRRADQAELAALDLHDRGGRARFTTPDGRHLEIELHGRDWPFGFGRDALVLILQEAGAEAPIASGWTEIDAERIGLDLEWLRVTCAPVAPDDESLRS